MSPEAQRIAIAEACGIDDIRNSEPWALWDNEPRIRLVGDINHYTEEIPYYLNDLNAMHEAERTLLFSERKRFRGILQVVMVKEIGPGVLAAIEECVHATAAQRAEAFLRTIGKWEEGK